MNSRARRQLPFLDRFFKPSFINCKYYKYSKNINRHLMASYISSFRIQQIYQTINLRAM